MSKQEKYQAEEDNRDIFDKVFDFLTPPVLGAIGGTLLLRGSHKLDKALRKRNPNYEITTHPKGDAYVRKELTKKGALLGGAGGIVYSNMKMLDDAKKKKRK